MSNLEKTIAKAFLEMAEGLETGSFGPRPRIALTGMGSEHGEENAMAAAVAALAATGPVTITRAQAVNKSYPRFWEDLESITRKEA